MPPYHGPDDPGGWAELSHTVGDATSRSGGRSMMLLTVERFFRSSRVAPISRRGTTGLALLEDGVGKLLELCERLLMRKDWVVGG